MSTVATPAAPPAAAAISVPKLSALKTGAVTPPAPASPEPRPVTGTPPVTPVAPVTPIVPAAEEDGIDTQIVKGGLPKTPADFAHQRRSAKEAAGNQTLEDAIRRADDAKMLYTQKETAYTALETKHRELEAQLAEMKTLSDTRKTEIEGLQANYFDANRMTLDINADQELSDATTRMLNELRNNVPSRVPTPSGQENRVFFDTLIQTNGAAQGLNEILAAYGRAKQTANEPACDLAINAFAKFLGADVDMSGRDEKEWRLLKADSAAFRAIETAMDKALPFFQQRNNRLTSFHQNAPQLAKQQYETRAIGIRQNLAAGIFLPPEVAAQRLTADHNDSLALFSQIVSNIPILKQRVEATMERYSATIAAIPDRLDLPTLATNDKTAIAAHQSEAQQHRGVKAEMIRNAVIGANIGPILASLISERDAAETRADAASANTNPGGSRAGGAGGSPEPSIDTQIVKAGM